MDCFLIIQIHMSVDFTVIFKLYNLIIIITQMRKCYTLVQNGKQAGVGAGNRDASALLPAFDITEDVFEIIVFFTFIIIVKVISCHILSLKCFTCIAVSIHTPVQFLLFPLQLLCLLQQSLTQICMYTFGCCFRLNHCQKKVFLSPRSMAWLESRMNT